MRELVLKLMGEYGNLAVFLLILVENLFPPIPSEVILTFGGVMTVCTDMTPGSVIFSATAGSLVGAVVLYGVGRFLPDEVFRKLLCGRTGHLLHFKPEDVDLAKGWFRDLTPEERKDRRQETEMPVWESFYAWLEQLNPVKRSKLEKAEYYGYFYTTCPD